MRDNPSVAAAEAALQTGDMVSAAPPTTIAAQAAGASTTPTTFDPAEAARRAQLAAFRAAADAFVAKVGWKIGQPLGQIIIPSIGVDVVMLEGTGKGDLREGPGHWPETPFPGQGGKEQVSLAACHPIYSATQRIVVQGDLVAFKVLPE